MKWNKRAQLNTVYLHCLNTKTAFKSLNFIYFTITKQIIQLILIMLIGTKNSIYVLMVTYLVSGTGVSDTGMSDTGVSDTGMSGTGVSDTGMSGTGVSDTGVSDTGMSDTGVSDIGVRDTGVNDTGE